MKILDKLKNALFEEEEIEIDESRIEKPKKEKKGFMKSHEEKQHSEVKITGFDSEEYEKPVAKKIVTEKKHEEKKEEIEPRVNKIEKRSDRHEFSFPMLEEEEFDDYKEEPIRVAEPERKIEKEEKIERKIKKEPKMIETIYDEVETIKEEPEKMLYQTTKEEEYIKKYTSNEYGNYGRNKEKKGFKPSPNISPVYGIIEESEVKVKAERRKEVRLTSAVKPERINIDDVRRKAYGTLEDDLEDELNDISTDNLDKKTEEMSIDLIDENTPKVKKVTMGDAEEYFQDLGLEYNSDYIDEKVENSKKTTDEEEVEKGRHEGKTKKRSIKTEAYREEIEPDDDNLFDLIDSMYDK